MFATGSKTARVGVQVFYFVNLCNRISTQWLVDAIDMILRFAQVEWGGVGWVRRLTAFSRLRFNIFLMLRYGLSQVTFDKLLVLSHGLSQITSDTLLMLRCGLSQVTSDTLLMLRYHCAWIHMKKNIPASLSSKSPQIETGLRAWQCRFTHSHDSHVPNLFGCWKRTQSTQVNKGKEVFARVQMSKI